MRGLGRNCAGLGKILSECRGRGSQAKNCMTKVREMRLSTMIILEVMDKGWPLWFVLLAFLGVGFVGMLLCRKWPLTAVLVLAWVVYGGTRQVLELNDPY